MKDDPWVELVLIGLLREILFFTVPGILIGLFIGWYFL